MIDIGASITTFVILFPTALAISYGFFYVRRMIRIRKYDRTQAEKEVV